MHLCLKSSPGCVAATERGFPTPGAKGDRLTRPTDDLRALTQPCPCPRPFPLFFLSSRLSLPFHSLIHSLFPPIPFFFPPGTPLSQPENARRPLSDLPLLTLPIFPRTDTDTAACPLESIHPVQRPLPSRVHTSRIATTSPHSHLASWHSRWPPRL